MHWNAPGTRLSKGPATGSLTPIPSPSLPAGRVYVAGERILRSTTATSAGHGTHRLQGSLKHQRPAPKDDTPDPRRPATTQGTTRGFSARHCRKPSGCFQLLRWPDRAGRASPPPPSNNQQPHQTALAAGQATRPQPNRQFPSTTANYGDAWVRDCVYSIHMRLGCAGAPRPPQRSQAKRVFEWSSGSLMTDATAWLGGRPCCAPRPTGGHSAPLSKKHRPLNPPPPGDATRSTSHKFRPVPR